MKVNQISLPDGVSFSIPMTDPFFSFLNIKRSSLFNFSSDEGNTYNLHSHSNPYTHSKAWGAWRRPLILFGGPANSFSLSEAMRLGSSKIQIAWKGITRGGEFSCVFERERERSMCECTINMYRSTLEGNSVFFNIDLLSKTYARLLGGYLAAQNLQHAIHIRHCEKKNNFCSNKNKTCLGRFQDCRSRFC